MTTTDGSDLLRFAVFCKKCSLYDENKCSRRVGQNAPKLGISRQFERRKNNDSSTFRMPRQDKRVDCILPQRGAVLGQITAYKKARYYSIATNKVLEPKI